MSKAIKSLGCLQEKYESFCCIQPSLFKTALCNPAKIIKEKEVFGASFSLILKCKMERSIFKKVRQFPDIFVKRSNTFLTEKALQSSIISPHYSEFLEILSYEKLILNASAPQYDYPHILGLERFIQISVKD